MPYGIETLQKRVAALEKQISQIASQVRSLSCNCRKVTDVHNSQELAQIVAIPCPEHGLRDPGCIMHRSQWMPLAVEFQQFCKCPPNAERDRKMKYPPFSGGKKIELPYQRIENPEEFVHNHRLKLEEQRELRRKEESERLMRPPSFDK